MSFHPAVQGADKVLSEDIREADGTSGQNTDAGAGVKTGHIQNNAVTTDKIASGAVTDAKISGVISSAKLPVGTTAGTVATGSHDHDGVYQKKYANVAVVAKSGGNYPDPLSAMADLATWCSAPLAASPCLLKIMPGVYDIGASLGMREYVAIEGSGKGMTIISRSNSSYDHPSVVRLASHAELRGLTIEQNAVNGQGTYHGVLGMNTETTITDVEVRCSGGDPNGYTCIGINLQNDTPMPVRVQGVDIMLSGGWNNQGLVSSFADLVVQDTSISTAGGSYQNVGMSIYGWHGTSATIFNTHIVVSDGSDHTFGINAGPGLQSLKIVASSIATSSISGDYGLSLYAGTDTQVKDSEITANVTGVAYSAYEDLVPKIYIANTKLDGSIVPWPGGLFKCFGVYDRNNDPRQCQ